MGDFNIDLLKCESSQISQDFLLSLRSCYLIPTVDKATSVHRTSATLIDDTFVNNPDPLLASGNIISDISDHFSQFCITTSAKDKLQQGMTMQFLYLSKLTNVLPITFFIVSPYQPYCTIYITITTQQTCYIYFRKRLIFTHTIHDHLRLESFILKALDWK